MSPRRLAWAAAALAAVGLVFRFLANGPLWLDEALSVSIGSLPLSRIGDALRHDGSPPLYYVLLHGWMAVFGESASAARALSGVLSLLTVPVAWAFAREVAGRRVAWVTALLVATSPFAARYGSEARMYALVQLLVALGGWALARLLRRWSWPLAALVAACSGLLALTHYWALYLLAAVFLGLVLRRRLREAAAVAAGGVLFVPWLPAFAYQLRHTGTPWAPRPAPGAVVEAVMEWAGDGSAASFLGVAFLLLAAYALLTRRDSRPVAALVFGTLGLGVVAGIVLGSGYAPRYSAVVVVPFLLLVALGLDALDGRARVAAVAGVALLGVLAAVPAVRTERTQAGRVAAVLRARARPGDVVVYCPDQLAPAVHRLLAGGLDERVFPAGVPERVDWVDYAERNESSDPRGYARALAGEPRTVWLVHAPGYLTYGDRCDLLADTLRSLRRDAEVVLRPRPRYEPERAGLMRFGP